MDQRKHSDASVNAKRAAAAHQGVSTSAFVPRKTKKTDEVQARIELVVEMVRIKEASGQTVGGYDGENVFHNSNRLTLSRRGRVHCAKLG